MAPGHGPVHLLLKSAEKLGFLRNEKAWDWDRPGLSLLAGPIQQYRAAVLERWRDCVSADLCGRKGFRVNLALVGVLLCNFSPLLTFGKEIRRHYSGGVWNGFLLGKVRGENAPRRFFGRS